MNVLVLAGGSSSEREISLKSGNAVAAALANKGYRTAFAVISEQGIALDYYKALSDGNSISDQTPTHVQADNSLNTLGGHDVVFTMMHGNLGENGTWQGLLRLVGLPFISADVKGSAVAMDKVLTKRIARTLDIPTPMWWTGSSRNVAALGEIRQRVPADIRKLVAKPVDQGSSVGVAIFENDDAGWAEAARICTGIDNLMVEQFVSGRELTCGWIGLREDPVGLPVVEIRPREGFYDYRAKYTKGASEYLCPAPIDEVIAETVRTAAGSIYRELELEPFARIDFILDEAGQHWFLEANTLPGFTELSLLPMAAAAVGVDYAELLEILMLCAVERHEREGGGR
ncbi:D-alanine--D-alanine ligase [bacterium]|nr:D-alanine--D-alanine ligase [bacterium]